MAVRLVQVLDYIDRIRLAGDSMQTAPSTQSY